MKPHWGVIYATFTFNIHETKIQIYPFQCYFYKRVEIWIWIWTIKFSIKVSEAQLAINEDFHKIKMFVFMLLY